MIGVRFHDEKMQGIHRAEHLLCRCLLNFVMLPLKCIQRVWVWSRSPLSRMLIALSLLLGFLLSKLDLLLKTLFYKYPKAPIPHIRGSTRRWGCSVRCWGCSDSTSKGVRFDIRGVRLHVHLSGVKNSPTVK